MLRIFERAKPGHLPAQFRSPERHGLKLDPRRNEAAVGLRAGEAARISPEDAALTGYVAAVDEEAEIARETARCLRAGPK